MRIFCRHIITKILFFQTLKTFILFGSHSGPCAGNLIGQDGVFDTFLNTTGVPFIGQLFSHLNRLDPLIDPFTAISFPKIGFRGYVNGQLRVNRFLNSFPANLSQPHSKRFGFRRRNGLDSGQEPLGIRHIGYSLFVVCRRHLQAAIICHGFIAFLTHPLL